MGFYRRNYALLHAKLGVIKRSLNGYTCEKVKENIWCWHHGFESEKYYIYNLIANDYRNYLTDQEYSMTRFINEGYCELFNNKILFEEVCSKYIRVPKNFALIKNGELLPLHGYDKNEILNYICENGCVLKPINGSQGDGVFIVKVINKVIYINERMSTFNDFINLYSNLNNSICTEFIRQGKFENELYDGSTNTIRIIAMRDPKTNMAFIAGAAQRIGSSKTGSIDNFTKGGLVAGINKETGELSDAITKIDLNDGNLIRKYDYHPDSGNRIKGKKVPNWVSICDEITNFLNEIPYIKYVGLDVALLDDGICLIEGNSHCQVGAVQAYTPLLKDEKVKRFYEYHGCLNRG